VKKVKHSVPYDFRLENAALHQLQENLFYAHFVIFLH